MTPPMTMLEKVARDNPPDPGTDAAINAGCTCPVIDNHRGRGWHGKAGIFIYTVGCPVHEAILSEGEGK